jgi:hypothetical protein
MSGSGKEKPADLETGVSENDASSSDRAPSIVVDSSESISTEERRHIAQMENRASGGRKRSRTTLRRASSVHGEDHHSFAEVRYRQHQKERVHDTLEMDRRIFYKSFSSGMDLAGYESGSSVSDLHRTETALSEDEFEEGVRNVMTVGGSEVDSSMIPSNMEVSCWI